MRSPVGRAPRPLTVGSVGARTSATLSGTNILPEPSRGPSRVMGWGVLGQRAGARFDCGAAWVTSAPYTLGGEELRRGWNHVSVELLVAVLFLVSVMVNMALFLWLSRADHVTLHWPRRLQSISQVFRQPDGGDAVSPVRRRPMYVAEHRPSVGGMPMSTGTSPTVASPPAEARSTAPDSAPRPSH